MKRISLSLALVCVMFLCGCGPSKDELTTSGVAEYQVGHLEKAKIYFNEVLSRYPHDSRALFYMGEVAQAEGFHEKAISYYQMALDADPSYKEARQALKLAKQDAGYTGNKLDIIPDPDKD